MDEALSPAPLRFPGRCVSCSSEVERGRVNRGVGNRIARVERTAVSIIVAVLLPRVAEPVGIVEDVEAAGRDGGGEESSGDDDDLHGCGLESTIDC